MRKRTIKQLDSRSSDGVSVADGGQPTSSLQLYQTKLEAENLLLRQVRTEYEARLARYADLYDFAPVGYFTLGRDGVIHEVNLTGAGVLGLDRAELIGRRMAEFVPAETRDAFDDFLEDIFRSPTKENREVPFLHAHGHISFTHVEANVDHGSNLCRMVVCDINERKQAELALIESEERFRLMADSAPVLIWVTGPDQQYLWFNQVWLSFTGRSLEEELGTGWTEGIHPDDVRSCMDTQSAAFRARRRFSIEYRLRSRQGDYHYVLAHGVPRHAPSGRFLGYIGSCTDISEHKKLEEELKHSRQILRHLVSYQERVREDERKRIAREIHDDLGQNLLALRIDVSMLHTRTGAAHPKLNERVKTALGHIDATIKAVRAAINNLRPTVLDLGLNAAIEWQVQDFQRRSGIDCELNTEDDISVDDTRATALFRILQESLNNVIRHAQASQVGIDLYRENNKLIMKIADNGIGIYPDCRRKANSFGLVGIQERINALGGELVIDTDQNKGTTLIVSLPMFRGETLA
ncbi:PAS domain S-box protein [Noviherbaspirillum sp.]|uniref:PAS domain-containing sensor histidine kinase n=1 Tax=Noviherbaspirillum sp. TaxID=1926288 RepID=UPI002B46C90D|nr:PAS domain S-box protein [Noviherbaspirillum sp.]HJV81783.1 PAS domain S-box protein [Noviherbaspirillum sp.]